MYLPHAAWKRGGGRPPAPAFLLSHAPVSVSGDGKQRCVKEKRCSARREPRVTAARSSGDGDSEPAPFPVVRREESGLARVTQRRADSGWGRSVRTDGGGEVPAARLPGAGGRARSEGPRARGGGRHGTRGRRGQSGRSPERSARGPEAGGARGSLPWGRGTAVSGTDTLLGRGGDGAACRLTAVACENPGGGHTVPQSRLADAVVTLLKDRTDFFT